MYLLGSLRVKWPCCRLGWWLGQEGSRGSSDEPLWSDAGLQAGKSTSLETGGWTKGEGGAATEREGRWGRGFSPSPQLWGPSLTPLGSPEFSWKKPSYTFPPNSSPHKFCNTELRPKKEIQNTANHYLWIRIWGLAYLLTFVCNPQVNARGVFGVLCRHAQSLGKCESPSCPVPIPGGTSSSAFMSPAHTGNGVPFYIPFMRTAMRFPLGAFS